MSCMLINFMSKRRKEPSKMAQQKTNFIFFIVIIVSLIITQITAYFSRSETSSTKYTLNCLALYTILIQWICFIHAGGFFGNERTEKFYDLTGSSTFLTTLALSLYYSHSELNLRKIILSAFVAIWSIRLGWFLFSRIHDNNGIDSRFTLIKLSRPRFMMMWTIQGLWVFMTALPVFIVNQSKENHSLSLVDYIGISLYLLGLIIEVVADSQKRSWQKLPKKKSEFVHTGLWTISRHPNYFGEIVLWIGISLVAFNGLSGSRALIVFLSPILVSLLLVFVSGIPSLEKKGNQQFGKSTAYQRYKKETPVLIPYIGRKGDARF